MDYAAAALNEYVISTTWKCLSDTPSTQKNPLFDRFLTSQEVFESLSSTASLEFCPGLVEVLEADTPPTLDFFKSLPRPADLSSVWAVYVIVMEKPSCRPRLYTGSATARQGARQRLRQYDNEDERYMAAYVLKALEEGYTMTHKGLLCWIPTPTAALVPVNRLVFVALEAAFSYIFWTMRKRTGNYSMAHICPWNLDVFEYEGVCSHCCLNETVRGDFDLTAEQLEAQAIEKEEKRIANKSDYHYKQMEENYDEYIGKAGERVAKSRANNPGRNAKYQADQVAKALANQTYHCGLCNIPFGTKQSMDDHMTTAKHLRKSNEAQNPFKCVPCNLGYHNKSNLTRHKKSLIHRQNVAAAQSSHSIE